MLWPYPLKASVDQFYNFMVDEYGFTHIYG